MAAWRRAGQQLGFMLMWPGLFFYFLGSKRTRVMVLCGNEILLIQDSPRYFYDDISWTLPGGGMRRGEAASTAAMREIKEELGLDIDPARLQLIGAQGSGNRGLRYQAYFFRYAVSSKPTIQLKAHEVKTARWFTIDAACRLQLKREAQQGLELLAAKR